MKEQGAVTITKEQIEEFKRFLKEREADEERSGDFNAGAIAGLYAVAMMFGIEL